jgi:hypothetical protein
MCEQRFVNYLILNINHEINNFLNLEENCFFFLLKLEVDILFSDFVGVRFPRLANNLLVTQNDDDFPKSLHKLLFK